MTTEERFWSKVGKPTRSGCRLWRGATNGVYGKFWEPTRATSTSRVAMAHRVAWWLANGRSIPSGMQIDHSCRRPLCVEPTHLEAVTQSTNVMRSRAPEATRRRFAAARCWRGHAMKWNAAHTRRVCHECIRIRKRRRR
jgi:hypothetical protein